MSSLSRAANISFNTVKRLWTKPYSGANIDTLNKIAKVLQVSMAELTEKLRTANHNTNWLHYNQKGLASRQVGTGLREGVIAEVGGYVDSAGKMHGFLLSNPVTHPHWQSIDDPNGVGTTTVNGINDLAQLVGFYVDSAGNTDGFLASK